MTEKDDRAQHNSGSRKQEPLKDLGPDWTLTSEEEDFVYSLSSDDQFIFRKVISEEVSHYVVIHSSNAKLHISNEVIQGTADDLAMSPSEIRHRVQEIQRGFKWVTKSKKSKRRSNEKSYEKINPAWREQIGRLITPEEVAKRIGVSNSSMIKELADSNKIISMDPEKWYGEVYPEFQFIEGIGLHPSIREILEIFIPVIESRFTVASWMVTPKETLEGLSPMQWLESGKDDAKVIEAAEIAAARLSF